MPGIGERIGDAYIRVHAQGEHLGDDIAAEFRGTEKQFGKIGEGIAEAEGEGYRKQMRKERVLNDKEAALALRRTARRMHIIGRETGSLYFQGLRKELSVELRDSNIGAEMARRIEEQFVRSGGDFGVVEKIIGDPGRLSRVFEDSAKHIREVHIEARRMNEEFDRTGRVIRRSDFVINLNRDLDVLGDTIGRTFGRGSRSEFLNFFGRLSQRMTQLLTLPVKLAANLFEMGRAFTSVLRSGGSLSQAFAQIGLTLPKLGAAFAGLAVVIGVVVLVIGPLVAAMSLLAGIVVALSSSVAFALVGSLASLVAILGPAAAAVGVLGLTFVGMSDKAKEAAKKALRPLGDEFQKLGAAARKGLFSRLPETVSLLRKAFSGLRPLVREIGIAIADVFAGFAKGMNTKGFRDFRDAMFTFLPGAVRKLGEIARHTLGGLGGLFRGMIPFMTDVLDALVRITRGFSDWANSAKGQTAIEGFFERVKASMKAVGGFLREVVGLIGDLFSAGRGTGNTLFTDMENAVRRFRDFIKSDPNILGDWFNSAKEFGRALGNLLIDIGKVLDALDSAESRNTITDVVRALGTAAKVTAGLINGLTDAINSLQGESTGSGNQLSTLDRVLRFINFDLESGSGILQSWKEGWTGVIELFQGGNFLQGTLSALREVNLNSDEWNRGINQTRNSMILAAAGIRGYNAVLLGLPTAVVTRITTPGAVNSKLELLSLARQYNLTPKEVRTIVKALGIPLTKRQLNDLLERLEKTDQFRGNPTIDPSGSNKGTRAVKRFQDALKSVKLPDSITRLPQFFANLGKQLGAKPKAIQVTDNGSAKKLVSKINGLTLKNKDFKVSDGGSAAKVIDSINRKRLRNKSFNVHVGLTGPGARFVKTGGVIGGLAAGGLFDLFNSIDTKMQKMQSGGFANFAQTYVIGESGREAIVPLDRPLSLVDPSVRALAAFAQGKIQPASSVGVDASGWTIVTKSENPAAVAQSVLNRLTAAAY
jgi:hypothetical protein